MAFIFGFKECHSLYVWKCPFKKLYIKKNLGVLRGVFLGVWLSKWHPDTLLAVLANTMLVFPSLSFALKKDLNQLLNLDQLADPNVLLFTLKTLFEPDLKYWPRCWSVLFHNVDSHIDSDIPKINLGSLQRFTTYSINLLCYVNFQPCHGQISLSSFLTLMVIVYPSQVKS